MSLPHPCLHYAAAIGRQQHAAWIVGVDKDVIHNQVGTCHAAERFAAVRCFVEALCRARINNLVIDRILLQHPRAPRGRRNPLDLAKLCARTFTFVNSAAGAQKNCLRLAGSRMIENTSESSIIPCLMLCQVLPPSVVFQGRCHVPAYTTSGSAGSTARDSTS